jgi:hypothetical protein
LFVFGSVLFPNGYWIWFAIYIPTHYFPSLRIIFNHHI